MSNLNFRRAATVLLLSGTFALSGCVAPGGYPGGGNYRSQQTCQDCGRVTDIVQFHGDERTTGAGVVAGAVLGGLVGNQVGGGSGRRAATVVGAVAGGVAGHHVEQNVRAAPTYDVHVRLDNGRHAVLQQRDIGQLRVGSYVRVSGGRAHAI
jgi:outer membrane lipoprotein SlyB